MSNDTCQGDVDENTQQVVPGCPKTCAWLKKAVFLLAVQSMAVVQGSKEDGVVQ